MKGKRCLQPLLSVPNHSLTNSYVSTNYVYACGSEVLGIKGSVQSVHKGGVNSSE